MQHLIFTEEASGNLKALRGGGSILADATDSS
jgi:hypothetical protein